jgi:imidazoleglycerol phosphate synthase glutamine amidotransferase subunit HisH
MFKVKTVLLAALLATSVSVSAQEENAAGSVVVPGLGEVTVVAAIISNSDGDTAPEVKATCNGTDALVNNVCVGSREEVVVKEIVTGTGTGTATATATTTGTALVSFTYAPTVR